MEKGNVLILGNSGVGKSTLINAIYKSNVAAVAKATREGVTKKLKVYERESMPFRLIDTIGFEPGLFRNFLIKREVKQYTKNIAKGNNDQEYINMIWFCIDGTSPRLFNKTIDDFIGAIKGWETIPICIVITKSYSSLDTEANINVVKDAIKKRKIGTRVVGIIPVVAEQYVIEQGIYKEPFGLDDLIKCTNDNLPEGMRAAKRDVENLILEKKNMSAHISISLSTAAGAAVCAIPIPFPDTVPLTAIETFEVETIANIYGLKDEFKKSGVIQYIIEAGAIAFVGKSIANVLKAVPGINLTASVINSIVGGSIVAAIGKIVQYSCEQVYKGEKTIDNIDWIKKIVDSEFSKGILSRLNAIADEVNKLENKNAKEIARIIIEELSKQKE